MVKQPEIHLDPEPQRALPCPFKRCFGKPTSLGLLKSPRNGEWWVYCKHCSTSGPVGHNEVEAVEFWNDRRPPDPLPLPTNPYTKKLAMILLILALASMISG